MEQKVIRDNIRQVLAERLGVPTSELSSSLKQKQSAVALDVTPGTMDVWTCTGRYYLPYYKVGREKVYLTEDLIDFVLSRRVLHGEAAQS